MRDLSARIKSGLWFAPAAVLVLLVFVYPIVRTVSLSFIHLNLSTGFQPQFAGLDNFARLISDSRFFGSLRVTALFTVASVALEFLFGLLAALAAEKIGRGKRTARTLLLIPWTLPTAIIAVLWLWIFNDQYGFINAILARLGVIDSPIAWLGRPHTALLSITMADVWKAFPFVYIVLLAGLQSIPREMYEAMDVDGGNAWHKFRYITLPHLLPFIFLALIFRIVQAFAVFDLVYVLTGGGPGGATETISVYGYYTFMRYLDFGYGAALVVSIVLILALIAWILYSLLLRKYEMAR
ncbi:MAG: sugar ABC transporter permease [Acidobacteria bacterium]|nr:sugar ABC transporter permease [Acidobacteriota bacterium]